MLHVPSTGKFIKPSCLSHPNLSTRLNLAPRFYYMHSHWIHIDISIPIIKKIKHVKKGKKNNAQAAGATPTATIETNWTEVVNIQVCSTDLFMTWMERIKTGVFICLSLMSTFTEIRDAEFYIRSPGKAGKR